MNWIITSLLALAIILIECLVGGTRFVFSLPAYIILGSAGLLAAADYKNRTTPNRLCFGVTVLVFAYLLVRAVLSPVEYLARSDMFTALACLLGYALVALYVGRSRHRSALLWTLFGLGVFEVFVGLRQFAAGDNWMLFGFLRADYKRRASGTFINANHLAGFLEVVAVFACSFAVWSRWKLWARIAAGYIGFLSYIGIAVTGSRGGYLSALLSMGVFIALSLYAVRKTRPGRIVFMAGMVLGSMAVCVGIALGLMNLNSTLKTRLALIPRQLEERDVRLYNWQAAIKQFRVSPAFGTGAGTHLYLGRTFRHPKLQSDPIHAHSDYLELLAEYGLVGFAGISLLLLVHACHGAKKFRNLLEKEVGHLAPYESARHNKVALSIGALSAFAAYVAHSAVDFNLHIPGNALVLAVVFGWIASSDSEQGERPAASFLDYGVTALAILLLGLSIPRFAGEYWAERARVALVGNRFTEAIALTQKAIKSSKDNPEVYFTLGEAYRGMATISVSRYEREPLYGVAVEAYRLGLELYPQNEHAWMRMAQCYDGLRAYAKAEVAYETALALDPNLWILHARYRGHLQQSGRQKEVEQESARMGGLERAMSGVAEKKAEP